MSSQVVRIQGFKKGSLTPIGREVERKETDLLENRNQDIDKKRTRLNKFYKHTKNGMHGEWKDICKNLNVVNSNKLRKNTIAFEGMIITSDKLFFENLGYIPGQKPPEKVKQFFNQAYEFAKKEIGFNKTDENIITACVHYDETTPHLQLYYVPVVDSWKEKVYKRDKNGKVMKTGKNTPIQARDDRGKIIYNQVINSETRRINRTQFWQNKGGKNSYSQMQDRFYEQISMNYGLGRGEKGSTKEHTTKAQWEAKKLLQEKTSIETNLNALKNDFDKFKNITLNLKEINNLEHKKTLVGDKVKISISDFNNLKNASKKLAILETDISKLIDENNLLLKNNNSLSSENDLKTKKNLKLHSKLNKKIEEFEEWKDSFNVLLDIIKKQPSDVQEKIKQCYNDEYLKIKALEKENDWQDEY